MPPMFTARYKHPDSSKLKLLRVFAWDLSEVMEKIPKKVEGIYDLHGIY
jgi:hypothetical protein